MKIAGMAGSLCAASYSRMVLGTLADHVAPEGDVVTVDIGALPHYCEDLERGDLPEAVARARKTVAASDAVVIVTPEFNHGVPGVLKNTLDWLSRPAFTSCIVDKPIFFMTVSPGALGGVRAQSQMRETLASMLCRLVPLPEIAITHIGNKVTNGRLTDPAILDFMTQQWRRFVTEVTAHSMRAV